MKKDKKNIFIICLAVLIVVLISIRFQNTFGSDTDWINQHTIFPEYFRNMFYATGRLLPNFTFNYGAGQNLFNISYYGLLSPLILPSYLLPFLDMVSYMTIIGIIAVMASGILFYKWLCSNHFDRKLSLVSTLIFIFAESFIFHFHRHIMFVNYMPFLVMSLIGIDKLILNNKKSFLIISVFLMIMTSYYYSVSGFLVLGCYYIYKYLSVNKEVSKKIFFKDMFKALLYMILAVLLASILLLPTIYTILNGRGTSDTAYNLLSLFVPSLKIHSVFCGTYAIGYSMLGFVAFLYLFFTKKKNNVTLGILLAILLFFPIVRYVLNGGLYLREKCFIPFIPLIGMLVTIFLKDLFANKIDIKKFLIYLIVINVPLYFFNRKELCFLYLIGIIILLYIFWKKPNQKFVAITLVLTSFIICLAKNFEEDFVSISMYKDIFNQEVAETINSTLEQDDGFYRTDNLRYSAKTVNKIYDAKYYTTNLYSSTYNPYYLSFIRNVFKNNMPDINYFFNSASSNNLFNTFMGVKYIYSDYDVGLGYSNLGNNVYVNENVYPIGFAISNITNEADFDNMAYPYNLEYLFNSVVSGTKPSNQKLESHIEKVDLDFEVTDIDRNNIQIIEKADGYQLKVLKNDKFKIKLKTPLINKVLFINLNGLERPSCGNGNTYLNINNISNLLTCTTWIYHNHNEDFHYVLTDEEIQELEIEIGRGTYDIKSLETYIMDYDYLKEYRSKLDEFVVSSYENDTIVGTINVNEDGYFMTTIPYDKGFSIKVNGINQEYEMVDKAFLGFPIKKGNYKIEITYKSPWLNTGILLTSVSFLIFGLIFIYENKVLVVKKSKTKKN